MRNITTMLSFESHPEEIRKMKDIINRNIFYGALFIKADGSLRPVNGRKVKYVSKAQSGETRGVWNRPEHNILTVFDRNKQQTDNQKNPLFYVKDGKSKPLMNAPISIRLDRLLFFKAGNFVLDFTQENADAIAAAKITPDKLDAEKRRMGIEFDSLESQTPLEIVDPNDVTASPENPLQEIVREEMNGFLGEGFDYQKKLGKVIDTTNQMIQQAKTDDVMAIEPDSTWESGYIFDKVVLMNTRLKVYYKEDNGRGLENKVDEVNLTQDRNINFMDSKATLNWIRRAIRKGYTENRRMDARQKSIEDKEAQEYNKYQQQNQQQ